MFTIIEIILLITIILFIIYNLYHICNKTIELTIILNLAVLILILVFIILFERHNNQSIKVYEDSLKKIENIFTNTTFSDINSIISNHNIINSRIIFLEERIIHHQNNSNNFASLWLTLLSVLFITVTGFNLYNFNENKKNLEKIIKEGEDSVGKINKKINEVESLRVEIAESNNNSLKKQNDKIEDGEGNNV